MILGSKNSFLEDLFTQPVDNNTFFRYFNAKIDKNDNFFYFYTKKQIYKINEIKC